MAVFLVIWIVINIFALCCLDKNVDPFKTAESSAQLIILIVSFLPAILIVVTVGLPIIFIEWIWKLLGKVGKFKEDEEKDEKGDEYAV